MTYTRIARLRTPEQFAEYLQQLGLNLEFDAQLESGTDSPLSSPIKVISNKPLVTNRFCTQPMEGWDALSNGSPSELTFRRWKNFGRSGAKLIWGGEAVAILPSARANPNQLVISEDTLSEIEALRQTIVSSHKECWPGEENNLVIGLQLTHSGRFCRPTQKDKLEPQILYHHPLLDQKFNLPPNYPLLTDSEIRQIIDATVSAAVLAEKAGFDFVDIKHCHGYLGHEFLSARDRPGPFGGDFENRTRYLSEIVEGIRSETRNLEIGVRLSAFDFIPFQPGPNGMGEPVPWLKPSPYSFAFGGDDTGTAVDLSEPNRFLSLLEKLGINLVNITAGSPYYVPHIQRPALFPPSDGYDPPEDPLVGVARLIHAAAFLKKEHPGMIIVGTGYTYLQEWLPYVAQNVIRTGKSDFIGLGRMMLTYPEIISDILSGRPLQRKRICRSFSDCTTAPRNGMVSGCYPLDEFYKSTPEAVRIKEIKRA